MAVFFRHGDEVSPPSIISEPGLSDDDFLLNPEQHFDELPQPYRRISKIIANLLDCVWQEIENKQTVTEDFSSDDAEPYSERPVFSRKRTDLSTKPSELSKLLYFDNRHRIGVTSNADGELVIKSTTDDKTLAKWPKDEKLKVGVEINYIQVCDFPYGESCLIFTIDELGIGRLFLFVTSLSSGSENYMLYLLQTIQNLVKLESSVASMVLTIGKICQSCDYLAVGGKIASKRKDSESINHVILIFCIPKDYICKELAKLMASSGPRSSRQASTNLENEEVPTPRQVPRTPAKFQTPLAGPNSLQLQFYIRLSINSPPSSNLVGVAQVMKGVQENSPSKLFDISRNVLLTEKHNALRKIMFEYHYGELLRYLPSSENQPTVDDLMILDFKFLRPNRFLPEDMEETSTILDNQGNFAKPPTILMVHWNCGYQINFYSLIRKTKEPGGKPGYGQQLNSVPDLVSLPITNETPSAAPSLIWPLTGNITASTVSNSTLFLAIALNTGNIIVWNLNSGMLSYVAPVLDFILVSEIRKTDSATSATERNRLYMVKKLEFLPEHKRPQTRFDDYCTTDLPSLLQVTLFCGTKLIINGSGEINFKERTAKSRMSTGKFDQSKQLNGRKD